MTEERHAYMGTAIEKFNEEGKLWWLRLCPACGALVGAMEQK